MSALAELVARRATADRTFVRDPAGDRTVDYATLHERAVAWRRALDRAGVPDGARIGCCIGDPVDHAVLFVSLVAAGRRVVPLDPAAPVGAVARVCAAADPALLITDLPTAPAGIPVVRLGSGAAPPAIPFTVRRSGGAHGGGALLFSSGTTGEPKGVPLDEPMLLAAARNVVAALELCTVDVGYCPLPTHHVNAQVVAILGTLTAGGSMVLADRFHRTGFWRSVARCEATWINAVPAIVAILAADEEQEPERHRIRLVRTGSAPLPGSVSARFERRFGIPVIETYGMTEAASQITANPVRGPRPAGSAGRPVGVELVVRRADGTACAPGEIGRVHVRGASVIRSYLAGRHADRFDRNGFLDTGDLGRVDADGFVYLAGRIDDVINRGGQKVLPRVVEDVLRAEPAVADAAVVGRPDEVLGAVPVAYVAAAPGARIDPAALRARCREHLARYQVPVEIRLLDAIPRSRTGKLAATALTGTAAAGTARAGAAPSGTARTDAAPAGAAGAGTAPSGTAPAGTAPAGTAGAGAAPNRTAPAGV